jgi:pimeloyl-ACP methyl ester carboxylesterase
MHSYRATTGYGNVRANEYDTVWKPNRQRPSGKYGVVLIHGSGESTEFVDPSKQYSNQLPAWLAWSGIPCVAAEMSGQSWATDPSQVDVDSAITWLNAVCGTPTTKVHLVCVSMGGAVGLRYAENNPTKVASYTGILPLLNLNSAYTTNYGGLRSAIGTAWGVTYPTALPAGAAIDTGAAALNGVVPSRVYYSSSDATIDPTVTQAVATSMGATTTNLGTNGHSEASIGDAIARGGGGFAEVISFLLANGA